MAGPVVVGYDGRAPSRRALAYAGGMSRPVVLAFVSPTGNGYDLGLAPTVLDLSGCSADIVRWLVADAAEVLGADGSTVEPIDLRGETAVRLGELADRRSACAVVVGRPERRRHRLIGSVPTRLARRTRCPLIVVP